MNYLKRTCLAFLALTAITSDVAFGQFAPPPGGPPPLPSGGPPPFPVGRAGRVPTSADRSHPRPPMASHGRPPVSAQKRLPVSPRTRVPIVGGAKGRLAEGPGRGRNNLSGNIRNTVSSGGNINGNRTFMNSGSSIVAKDSGNLTVNNSGDLKVSGNSSGYFGRGYYGRGDHGRADYGGGDYGRGYGRGIPTQPRKRLRPGRVCGRRRRRCCSRLEHRWNDVFFLWGSVWIHDEILWHSVFEFIPRQRGLCQRGVARVRITAALRVRLSPGLQALPARYMRALPIRAFRTRPSAGAERGGTTQRGGGITAPSL